MSEELRLALTSDGKVLVEAEVVTAIRPLIEYIKSGDPDLEVVIAELGEMLHRVNGTYLTAYQEGSKMTDVKRLKDYTVVTVEQQVEFRNAALEVEKDYRALQAENERLKAVIEDRSMNEHDEIGAADSYWEIAEVLNVPEGSSVIEFAAHLVSDEYINKLKADAVREYADRQFTVTVHAGVATFYHLTSNERSEAHKYANKLEAGDN